MDDEGLGGEGEGHHKDTLNAAVHKSQGQGVGAKVYGEACQGPRKNYVTKVVKRKERHEKKEHAEALQEWELANPECSVPPVARVS